MPGPTLREVCGLTTEEIARAFLTGAPTLAQRIVRAKAKIKAARIPYEVPSRADLPEQAAYGIARALDGARGRIAFDSEHPVSLEEICRDSDTTALDVPLHPGAERYYTERGALP